MKDSIKFHEIKLFLILEHFDQLNIEQLNSLIDVIQLVYFTRNPKKNPIFSQYNTVKLSLLIYRVSWLISQKKVYSLITKC